MEGRRDEKTREESLFSPDEPSLAAARSQSAAPVSRRVPSPHLFGGSFPLVRLLYQRLQIRGNGVQQSATKSAFELFFIIIKSEHLFEGVRFVSRPETQY